MRDRPHADIPDDDTDRDSDAPTQLWSGRLSFASITPRLRAVRHRQRLEALLNTQTGITYDAASELPATKPRPTPASEKPSVHQQSTNPPLATAAATSPGMSGPQLALFVAVGVAVGGIAALHLDHILHPFSRHDREVHTAAQSVQQAPASAARGNELHTAAPESKRDDLSNVRLAAAPIQPARSLTPKLRSQGSEANLPAQVNPPLAATATPAKPPEVDPSDELRIPTQLHPRINPLMTSNQVFREK